MKAYYYRNYKWFLKMFLFPEIEQETQELLEK